MSMPGGEEKKFSKEDLDLVGEDSNSSDDGDDGDTKTDTTSKDDNPNKSTKDKTSKYTDSTEKVDKGKSRESVFDDGDDDDEDSGGDKTLVKDNKTESSEDSDGNDKNNKKYDKDDKDDDWRERLISSALKGKENELTAAKLTKRQEALRKELARYKTPEAYMLAGMAAREKIKSGEYKRTKLPDDATDEEISAFRKDNGIPDDAKDYEIPKIAGHKWTEDDTPFLESFKGIAHKAHINQDQLNNITQWYADNLAEQQDAYLEKIASQDRYDAEQLEDKLRAELGPADYKPASKLVQRFLKDKESGAGSFEEKIRNARFPDEDGNYRRLINDHAVARWLVDLAHDTYGDAALISGDAKAAISNRKAEIEKIMKEDMNRYWKEGLSDEYTKILKEEQEGGRSKRRA